MIIDIAHAVAIGIIIFYLSLPSPVHDLCFFLFWIGWGIIGCIVYIMIKEAFERIRA